MNPHDQSWRMRHGLRWQGTRPTLGEALRQADGTLKSIIIVLAIFVAYGIVGRMDREDALVAEAASAQRIATQRSEQLIACLNGKPPGLYTENHRGERTYIVCREAEEIPVGKVRS